MAKDKTDEMYEGFVSVIISQFIQEKSIVLKNQMQQNSWKQQ